MVHLSVVQTFVRCCSQLSCEPVYHRVSINRLAFFVDRDLRMERQRGKEARKRDGGFGWEKSGEKGGGEKSLPIHIYFHSPLAVDIFDGLCS